VMWEKNQSSRTSRESLTPVVMIALASECQWRWRNVCACSRQVASTVYSFYMYDWVCATQLWTQITLILHYNL
jgi:hypothetical protein